MQIIKPKIKRHIVSIENFEARKIIEYEKARRQDATLGRTATKMILEYPTIKREVEMLRSQLREIELRRNN